MHGNFHSTIFFTSEQHKETRTSRTQRDRQDLKKIADKLKSISGLSNEVSFVNIITGINANKAGNVHDLFTIGKKSGNDGRLITVFY